MPALVRLIGIDVAKDKLDIHIAPSGERFTVSNTAAAVEPLADRFETGSVIALEASGGYERSAAESLAADGLTVLRLHPADVRAFARMAGKRAKTDRLDAALIARAAEVAVHSRKPCRADPAAADLKEMAACRRLLHDQRAALKGPLTRLAVKLAHTILARQIAVLEAAIRRIEAAMAAAIARHPRLREDARRTQTAPGAGPVLAATLVACMPELGTLTSRQAASLTGVAPHPRPSGSSRARGRCQGGRAPVRAVLYVATLAAIRSRSSTLRAFYQRLRANGKPFKLALVAAMRKFIVTLNTMPKNHQDWHPHPT